MNSDLRKRLILAKFASDMKADPMDVVRQIDRYEKVRDDVAAIDRKRRDAIEKHNVVLACLAAELFVAQNACDHPVIDYQGDPSGGSDRNETCAICGKDTSDPPYRHS